MLNDNLYLTILEAYTHSITYALFTGVIFRAVATIPSDCKGDQLCEMSKNVTKDEKKARSLIIEGQITLNGAEFKGIYEGQWSLGKNVKIPKVELVLKIGKETKVYFAVIVEITEPKLQLEGTLIIKFISKGIYFGILARISSFI